MSRQVVQRRVATASTAKEEIDYDAGRALAHEHKPKLIIAGASAYSLRIDWERFRAIADEVGALLHGRHGALRRPDRRRRLSDPGPHRRLRHHAPRTRPCAARAAASSSMKAEHEKAINSRDLPRHAGRPADARDRRQGGGVQGSAAARVQGLPAAGARERARAGRGAAASAACASSRAAPTSHMLLVDLRAKKHHRQGSRGGARRARTSPSTRTPSRTIRKSRSSPAASASARPAMTTRGFSETEARAARAT